MDRFAALGGGDSFPVRKPDPGHLLATIEAAGGMGAGAVMIGDHRNDIAAARGAGIPCVFVGWGYGTLAMADGAPVAVSPASLPGEIGAALDRLRPQ
jgi:phosphoglycolate phosphatase